LGLGGGNGFLAPQSHSTLDFRQPALKDGAMARVVIGNLAKIFQGPKGRNIPAVSQFSLTVEDGELLALVGPSGGGGGGNRRNCAVLAKRRGAGGFGDWPRKKSGCGTGNMGYVASMDWQQAVSLGIVSAAAALLFWGKFRPRKFNFKAQTHCGCAPVNKSTPQNSIVFRARRGERPQITVKMK
jgi:energy-coupling factor transporter ATP-binding protein EcfA2